MIHDDWESLNKELLRCDRCQRLVAWRELIASRKRKAYRDQGYWGKPVPGFGDPDARVLVVGLAPGAHGSNRTGRMFTGDSAGSFLYRALHKAGFCNKPESKDREDGLMLNELFISALCRCVPPENRPEQEEIKNCRSYLQAEVRLLQNLEGIVCLGRLAFDEIKTWPFASPGTGKALKFSHHSFYDLENSSLWVAAAYHPSQQNTQTGRLTVRMFDQFWSDVRSRLEDTGRLCCVPQRGD